MAEMKEIDVKRALVLHCANAMEQAGLGLSYCFGGMSGVRSDLSLLCMENAVTSLRNFMEVYAKWLGEGCPPRWRAEERPWPK